MTGDRTEFFGRNGMAAHPVAMTRSPTFRKVGSGLDPCGAMQLQFDLAAGQEREIVFVLGAAANVDEARSLFGAFRGVRSCPRCSGTGLALWGRTLRRAVLETPDAGLNALVNGWLVYSDLACRFVGAQWFLSIGGAFGSGDQLQDVMAWFTAEPGLCAKHLLRAASHQFSRG